MSAQQNFLGLVDPRREVRRAPLVGMEFLHERAVGGSDLLRRGAGLKAKDLIGLLLRHYSRPRASVAPRVSVRLSVFTPSGKPAVEIRL